MCFFNSYLNANDGGDSPNGAVGAIGAQALITNITDTRTQITGMALSKTLQIGTAEAGSYFNTQVLSAVDYGMANVHPWFANVSVDAAADWTAQFFQEEDVDIAETLSNQPTMYIAETGWPTVSLISYTPLAMTLTISGAI
jgi:exo-beta-1,3-glucanase (GH17 family)